MANRDPLEVTLPLALRGMHVRSSMEPIRFPAEGRVFPTDFLLLPPPVVPDANRLRDDILYACSHDQGLCLSPPPTLDCFVSSAPSTWSTRSSNIARAGP